MRVGAITEKGWPWGVEGGPHLCTILILSTSRGGLTLIQHLGWPRQGYTPMLPVWRIPHIEKKGHFPIQVKLAFFLSTYFSFWEIEF